jgi:CheY-like chemotaxis protein
MKSNKVRVIVASEYPEAQDLLQGVVEEEQGVVTVGKAKDTYETLALARNLRPDVAVIDFNLPYVSGFDTVPLSRMGGLDTAQTISEEIPNTRVILLNNLDQGISLGRSSHSGNGAIYSIVNARPNGLFTLRDLSDKLVPPNALVFANVEVKQESFLGGMKGAKLYDKAILFGGLGLAAGWLLTITVIFVPVGVPLALAGGATMFLGLAGKLTFKIWHRLFRKSTRLQDTK